MPEHVWFPEFRDANTGSLYPFADSATLMSVDGQVVLDRDMFVDAALYPLGNDGGLCLTQVDATSTGVTLWFGTAAALLLCSVTFDPYIVPGTMAVYDTAGRPAGMLVCDVSRMAVAQTWAHGTHKFTSTAAPFVATCVIPMPDAGLTGLTVNGAALAGDLWLVGADGVVLTHEPPDTIRVDVVGDPLYTRRQCPSVTSVDSFDTPRFVKTINGVAPGPHMDFHFRIYDGDTVLRVVPIREDTFKVAAVGKKLTT